MEEEQQTLFPEKRIFTVSEIVEDIKRQLESGFRNLWIQGEISNLRRSPAGHTYFTLKDEDSQLSAVCFRFQSRYLKFRPEDGMDVTVRGSVSIYPPRGQLQFIVEFMEPKGRGALQLAFEEMKARLEAEGLFDPARKKPLPLLPSKIGVVTSPTGAAFQDILRVLKRRNDRLNILLFPVRVQGREAPGEIAEGIRVLSQRKDLDVILIGRGGGSLEDLWAFNEEIVARAIFESQTPIISAVGHEIDFTISDFVADLRAPTPSAAAEIVSAGRNELLVSLRSLRRRFRQAILYQLNNKKHAYLRVSRSRGFIDTESKLKLLAQRLDELSLRLGRTVPLALNDWTDTLSDRESRLKQNILLFLKSQSNRAQGLEQQLKAFSPLQVLERGYAIVTSEEGTIVRDAGKVPDKALIGVRVAKGAFRARRENPNEN